MRYDAAAINLVVSFVAITRAAEPTAVPSRPGWALTFHDEFDGDKLDPQKWTCETGSGFQGDGQWIGGWGNDELEFYTNRPENVSVRDGALHIRARHEPWEQCQYTSGKISTKNLFDQTYGRYEFRAKLPVGQGLWPAMWMLPSEAKYGVWAASGEIDVAEARGQTPTQMVGTLHFGGKWPNNAHAGCEYTLPTAGRIDEFHVYAVEWEPGVVRWYVDDKLAGETKKWWSNKPTAPATGDKQPPDADVNPFPAPFDQKFYLLMNLAVGGRFLGNPDGDTAFPAEMTVDYVRVYKKAE